MEIRQEQRNLFAKCLKAYRDYVDWISKIVEREYSGFSPSLLKTTKDSLLNTSAQLNSQSDRQLPFPMWTINALAYPVIKRAWIFWRRQEVRNLEQQKQHTTDKEFHLHIDERIQETALPEGTWFRQPDPLKHLRLTDFFTLRKAEELMAAEGRLVSLPTKVYGEKFGILSPSSSVGPELEYWRNQCDLRGVGLAIAYLDIDNFKQVFNTPYSETIVDREVLPPIMRTLEAHSFKHGSAFHEGGDEFFLLFPNVTKAQAIESLDRLRCHVMTLKYHGINAQGTFSIGMYFVEPDNAYTDAESLLFANMAKMYAKKEGGKNCVVVFDGIQDNKASFVVAPKNTV